MRIVNEKNNQIGIDENGFFENEELTWNYPPFTSDILIDDIELNRYLYSLYEKMDVRTKDVIGLFIAESFAKIHRDFQSIVILSVRGLQSQSKAILRTMLEKLLILVSVEKNPNNYNDWLRTQNYNRNKLIRAIKRGDIDVYDIDTSKLVENPDAKNISTDTWAKRADMEWDYRVIYKLFNSYVHLSERSVSSDIVFENGEPVAIGIYPDYSETDNILVLGKRYILIAAKVLKKYFNIHDEMSFQDYQAFLDDAQRSIQILDAKLEAKEE